jgi:hypothetical protein
MPENFYRNKFTLGAIPQLSGVSRNRWRYVKTGDVWYTTLDFKWFATDDRTANWWTVTSWYDNNATVSWWLWYGNNTDGHNQVYKNFAAGLSSFKIIHKTASCNWSDAWWWASWYFNLSDTLHTWLSTFDPPNILFFNRDMYSSAAQSYNGFPTYHRSSFTRKVSWTWTTTWATREWYWNTVWDAVLITEVEFLNWVFTYKVYSNWTLVGDYTFTANFTKVYSIVYWVGSSTGAHPQVDEISLYY